MKAFSMTPRQRNKSSAFYHLAGAVLILGAWHIASLFFPPLVVPPVWQVALRLKEILLRAETYQIIGVTAGRLISGLLLGIAIGALIGLAAGIAPPVDAMTTPLLNVFQSVPPVSWLVLALVWFGFNGRPTVFIVTMATIPPVAINLKNGIRQIDGSLLQMGRLYRLSRRKMLMDIMIPSVRPYLFAALEIVLGSGWKLCVMGEVLSTTTGIGGKIVEARLNIEPDKIIAWSVILVLLCWGTQKLLGLLIRTERGGHAFRSKSE